MLIGLIGAPRSGKGIIADYFVKYKGFKKFAFADKIKEGYFAQSEYTKEQFDNLKGTSLEKSIRKCLWKYSDAMKYKYGEDYFVNQVVKEFNKYENIVVNDIRLPIEKNILLAKEAKIILILRNYKEELRGEKLNNNIVLSETSLTLKEIIDYPKFWNVYNTIEETHKELEKFYTEEIMDPDPKNKI